MWVMGLVFLAGAANSAAEVIKDAKLVSLLLALAGAAGMALRLITADSILPSEEEDDDL